MTVIRISGMRLPVTLDLLLKSARWSPPADEEIFLRVFGELPDEPQFFGSQDLLRQNELWQGLDERDVFGESIEGVSLGVDLRRSIIIGVLGTDMPIVLDYRESGASPRVLYLLNHGGPVWVQVAADVEEFIRLLYE